MNRYTASGLAAIALWSVTVGLARSLSEKVGPLAGGACVYLVGGVFCLLRLRGSCLSPARLSALPRRYVFGCGGLFVLYLLSFYLAIGLAADRGQVLAVGLANYLWPTFTILFSLVLLGKRAGALLVPGTAAALAGVALVMAEGAGVAPASIATLAADSGRSGLPAAVLLASAGAVMWALYSNLTSRWMGDSAGGAVALFMLVTGIVLLGLSLAHGPAGSWDGRACVEAACLGLATGAGYECWEAAMRKGDVALIGACSYFTPLLSTLFSCLYLGILPGAVLWLGCGLIVVGSLLSWLSVR
ncbi:MAG: aromatic amino acid DMT transporter YddG [Elusimicrobia bacterium]|nr:aromatic amino acid DMT transporter YddG [Elusimicrobiota bacterium]